MMLNLQQHVNSKSNKSDNIIENTNFILLQRSKIFSFNTIVYCLTLWVILDGNVDVVKTILDEISTPETKTRLYSILGKLVDYLVSEDKVFVLLVDGYLVSKQILNIWINILFSYHVLYQVVQAYHWLDWLLLLSFFNRNNRINDNWKPKLDKQRQLELLVSLV